VGVLLRWIALACFSVGVCFVVWQGWFSAVRSPEELLDGGLNAIRLRQWQEVKIAQAELENLGRKGEHAILEAQAALVTGDYEKSVSVARYAESVQPEMFRYAFAIEVESLYKAGQLGEAESVALEWLAVDPDEPVAHRWLAAIYYDLGAMNQAQRHLSTLIELRPEDASPRFLLGVIFQDYERFEDAIGVFQALLQLPGLDSPTRLDCEQRLATCLIHSNRFQDALTLLEKSDAAVSLAKRAECLVSLGQIDNARALAKQAQAMEPDSLLVLSVLGQIQMEDADYPAATRTLTKLVGLDPSEVQASFRLAQCLRLLGRTEDADQQLKEFEARQQMILKLSDLHLEAIKSPWDPAIRKQMADLFDQIGDAPKAAMWRKAEAHCRIAQMEPNQLIPAGKPSTGFPSASAESNHTAEF